VTGTNPKNGDTNIPLNASISITFSKAMDKTATEGAISVSPSIKWTSAWSGGDTVVTLTHKGLQASKQYTVTISPAAKSSDGMNMASQYQFSFTTAGGGVPTPPEVSSTSPGNGARNIPRNTNIVITFSEAMDKASTEGAISSLPSIKGTFTWDSATKVLTWDPSTNLQAGTNYKITVGKSAKSKAGVNMMSDYTFTFTTGNDADTTPPEVVSTTPRDGAANVDPSVNVTVTFSEPMDQSSVEGAISFSPSVTITNKTWTAAGTTIVITATLREGVDYVVKISTAAKDLAGNHMTYNYTFFFTTRGGFGGGQNEWSNKGWKLTPDILALLFLGIILVVVIIFLWMRKKKKPLGNSLDTSPPAPIKDATTKLGEMKDADPK
jgi:hypothetical protein